VRELSRPPKPAPQYQELPWFKTLLGEKAKPEAPKDYVNTSIPRTRGPWRKQMQTLQADHNTVQKHRDALTKPSSKEKKPHA
jgi:hypothetical protein